MDTKLSCVVVVVAFGNKISTLKASILKLKEIVVESEVLRRSILYV